MPIQDTYILGIESSCDETGIGIYSSEEGLISHKLFSQIELHAEFGGVVPELASRDHIQKMWIPVSKNMSFSHSLSSQMQRIQNLGLRIQNYDTFDSRIPKKYCFTQEV